MLRRNVASQVVYLPALKLTADGTAVTSGASLTVAKDGTEAAASGTLTHYAGGVWKYAPTQSETDCAIMALILTYTAADPVVLNLVTTGADTSAVALGANTTAPDNAGISAAAADAAAAKTAAQSADSKLTSGRTSRLDRLPDVNAGAAGGLALVGSEMTLDSATLAALFSDTDTAALVDAIIARVEDDLDGSDLSVAAIAVAVRNEILNRLLAGNHDTDGSVGAFLQRLDAAVTSRLASGSYTAPDNAGISAAAASAVTAASQATTAATQATTAATQATTAATNTETLLTRVTAGAAQLWTDLIAMITGSGTADPQWTADSLALGPSGGGGGSGDAEQATLLEVQATVSAIASSLSGTPINPTGRVASGGAVTLYRGDDHTERSSTQLEIPVSDPAGGLFAKLSDIGVDNLHFGAARGSQAAGAIAGTISDLAADTESDPQRLVITVEITDAGGSLPCADDYVYQILSTQSHGDEVDEYVEIEGSLTLARRTAARA